MGQSQRNGAAQSPRRARHQRHLSSQIKSRKSIHGLKVYSRGVEEADSRNGLRTCPFTSEQLFPRLFAEFLRRGRECAGSRAPRSNFPQSLPPRCRTKTTLYFSLGLLTVGDKPFHIAITWNPKIASKLAG